MIFGRSGVGEIRIDVGSISSTEYGYTFQRNLPDTGLVDYKARAPAPTRSRGYDPWLGRFIQPDTIVPGAGNPQAWNRYGYVNNNPIKYNDPSGQKYVFSMIQIEIVLTTFLKRQGKNINKEKRVAFCAKFKEFF